MVELDDARRLEPGSFDPAEFLPAAYRSVDELEGFLEHLTREVHDPALRAVVDRVVFAGPLAADFRRAPCHPRALITPTSAACSSTRSPSPPWCSRPASCTRGSTRTC